MNRKGISLIILIITIVLILILVGITTSGIGNAVQNSRISSFGKDIVTIQDSVELYYVQNGEFPILEENGKIIEYVYNNDNLTSATGESIALNSQYLNEFKTELVENYDLTEGENVVSYTIFYKIDLNKISLEKVRRGTGKDGENDIYVMAYPSQTIYYVKGLEVDENIYFSSINISNIKKAETISQEVITQTENGITVTKQKKAWTNTLGINIKAELESNEKIYVKLPVRESEIELSTITGENNIAINSLIGSLSMTEEEVNSFNNLDSTQKVMNVIKKTDGVETANIKVNIANYETEIPTFPLKEDGETFDFSIISSDGYNEVSYIGSDSISGIGEVRYVYLTKFGNSFLPQSLYGDISILTPDYMLEYGKKAYVSNNGKVQIKLPKDIEAIYITMYDKAGNSVSMQKNVQTDIYIGINAVNISNNIEFNIGIKSNSDITSAKAWISLNGTDYIDEKTLTLTKDSNDIYNSQVEFENSQNKEVYIKVIAYDNSEPQIVETRTKKIDLTQIAVDIVSSAIPGCIYEDNRYYTDKNGDKAIVPAGFSVSLKSDEQTIDDGLVIIDMQDNEYVWIPCTIDGSDGTVKYAKWNGSKNTDYTVTKEQVKDDTLPTGVTSETYQITKYGGFYVARYEAGLPDEQTTETLMATKTFTVSDNNRTDIGKAQSKPNKIVWNRIDYTNAKAVSEDVISNDYVQSGLITGTQWDTMLTFLSQEVDVDTDCTSWGNYRDKYGYTIDGYYRTQHADVVYTKGEYTKSANGYLLLQTGKFGSVLTEGSPKNLFDVAGNMWEWSAEEVIEQGGSKTAVGYKLHRGGSYNDSGSNFVTSSRNGDCSASDTYTHIGFRFVLYVK